MKQFVLGVALAAVSIPASASAAVVDVLVSGTIDGTTGPYASVPYSLSFSYNDAFPLVYTGGTTETIFAGDGKSTLAIGSDTFNFNAAFINVEKPDFGPSYYILSFLQKVAPNTYTDTYGQVQLVPNGPYNVDLGSVPTVADISAAILSQKFSAYFRFRVGSASDSTDADAQLGVGSVPEPATWALITVGVGVVGGTLRRRRITISYG